MSLEIEAGMFGHGVNVACLAPTLIAARESKVPLYPPNHRHPYVL